MRFLPSFRWVRQLVLHKRAGRVPAVVFRDDQYILDQGIYGSTWRTDVSLAGRGTLLEHSIHDVDILQWLLGPVTAVSAHGGASVTVGVRCRRLLRRKSPGVEILERGGR